jgi:hypothetical protein
MQIQTFVLVWVIIDDVVRQMILMDGNFLDIFMELKHKISRNIVYKLWTFKIIVCSLRSEEIHNLLFIRDESILWSWSILVAITYIIEQIKVWESLI